VRCPRPRRWPVPPRSATSSRGRPWYRPVNRGAHQHGPPGRPRGQGAQPAHVPGGEGPQRHASQQQPPSAHGRRTQRSVGQSLPDAAGRPPFCQGAGTGGRPRYGRGTDSSWEALGSQRRTIGRMRPRRVAARAPYSVCCGEPGRPRFAQGLDRQEAGRFSLVIHRCQPWAIAAVRGRHRRDRRGGSALAGSAQRCPGLRCSGGCRRTSRHPTA
jgi:hypothetical protein